jgi:hypothetical protein
VGAFHSATGAIESAIRDVSPIAHWIALHLATAGGKRIKMRLLGTVITSRYYVYNETTARLCVQRAARLLAPRVPNQHELCRPVKISKALYSPLPQRREAQLATHSLPAESSLLPSECSGIWLHTNGPFQGPHFLIGCNVCCPQAAGPPAYPTSEDSCVVLRGHAPTSH